MSDIDQSSAGLVRLNVFRHERKTPMMNNPTSPPPPSQDAITTATSLLALFADPKAASKRIADFTAAAQEAREQTAKLADARRAFDEHTAAERRRLDKELADHQSRIDEERRQHEAKMAEESAKAAVDREQARKDREAAAHDRAQATLLLETIKRRIKAFESAA